jgi:hypothetical protein
VGRRAAFTLARLIPGEKVIFTISLFTVLTLFHVFTLPGEY